MDNSSRIVALAEQIRANTLEVDQYITANHLPTLSFDENAPQKLPLSEAIEAKRLAAINATVELQELLMTPREMLFDNEPQHLFWLHALYHFGMVHKIPIGGQSTIKEIASKCGIEESLAKRIVRYSAAYRIFQENQDGVISHSAISKFIAEDPAIEAYLGVLVEDMWKAAVQMVPALVKWPQSQEPDESGFSLAQDHKQTMYEAFQSNPARAQRFGAGMSALIVREGHEPYHVVENINWAAIGKGVVVDIGGAHGDMMIAVAKHCANLPLTFVVQDTQATVDSVPAAVRDSLPESVTFMQHDFFEPQPVRAKVYVLRTILHNWSDKYCIKILGNLKPVLEEGSRIIIVEQCLPEPGKVPIVLERELRLRDLGMLLIGNARERDAEDWKRLSQMVDPNFRLLNIKQPPQSKLAMIEISWKTEGDSILR